MKIIKCIDCGKDFKFSDSEARFYISKGLSEPKRCPKCRKYKGLKKNVSKKLGTRGNFEIL